MKRDVSDDDRLWWTIRELAEHYGLSTRTIYDAIASGDLAAYRFGRGRGGMRIAEEDRLRWEEGCRDVETSPSSAATDLQDRLVMSKLVEKHFGK